MSIQHLETDPQIDIFQHTEAGKKPENQDSIGARFPTGQLLASKGIAIVIADGVSAAEAAQEASQACVTGFLTDYFSTPDSWSVKKSATKVLQSLNRWLYGQSQSHIQGRGFLTTLSVLIIKSSSAYIFHVGDSRIYRFRQNDLEQLTNDHNLHMSGSKYYLSRAMGADLTLDVDYKQIEVQSGDQFLLTTDGVHDVLNSKTLAGHLKNLDCNDISKYLVKSALDKGSQDNLSCQHVVVKKLNLATDQESYIALKQLPFPPPLKPGQRLDTFTIKKIIHESERSQVYLVTDENNQNLVMKTPSPNYEDDSAYIERFTIEEWIGSRIHNAHLVRTVTPKQRSFLYFLSHYIDGPSLEELLKERGQLSIDDTVQIAEQLVKALRALHRKETLHQDIKPANIKISSQGAVLLDFGSCSVAGIEEIASPIERERSLGTAEYSAPEYRYGNARSDKSDQFSLAVVIYEMLTGAHPFGAKYETANTLKHFQAIPYRSALTFNAHIPAWLDSTLKKALSVKPDVRYESLSEFVKDLKEPNSVYLKPKAIPLLEKQPHYVLPFVLMVSLVVNLVLLYLLVK